MKLFTRLILFAAITGYGFVSPNNLIYTDPQHILDLYQLMKDAHELFVKFEIPYSVDGGTLLGAVRHRGIIPWDEDLDIQISVEHELKFLMLEEEFEKLGYWIKQCSFGYKVKGPRRQLDVFITKKVGKSVQYERQGVQDAWGMELTIEELYPLKLYDFGEIQVFGPQNPKPFLFSLYGKNYLEMAYKLVDHDINEYEKTGTLLSNDLMHAAMPTGPLEDRVKPAGVALIPKIAFLFLTIGNINHERPWVKFFKGHENQYSFYVHPKREVAQDSFFATGVIEQREETTWENCMNALLALLREALKDPANTKFVFVSDSTIPLANFNQVYDSLLIHPFSEFEYAKNSETVSFKRTFGSLSNVYKNHAWAVLSRKHAQLMVDDDELIRVFTNFPVDVEHYPSTLLAHHNLLHEVVNHNTLFEVWRGGDHPHFYKNLENDPFINELFTAINENYLFGRKFAPECNLEYLHAFIPELY